MKLFRFLKPFSLSVALLFPVLVSFALIIPRFTSAASYTWDGGGATNNWSECANWSTNICPIAGDSVTFNATSTKDSVVDAAWTASSGAITGITIASGYTGILSLERSLTMSGAFSIADGTFTANAQTVDFNGAVTISGGTFNASSGTTYIGANFTHTVGGTFNHNSGTVVFDAYSTTYDVATSETFYNVTMSKFNGYSGSLTSGDTFIVLGSLNLTDGVFWNGTIDMRGSATVVASTYDGGNNSVSNFTFSGSEEQTLNLTGGTAALDSSVVVNKSGGALTMLSGYNLDYSGKTFTLQAGTLNPNGNSFATLAFTQSGGTFAAQAGALDFNGAFVLSGGAFNASSGTTYIGANFTHTAGGTFNHNNGTVVFDGYSTTYDVATSETFYNVTMSKVNGFTGSLTSGDTFIVLGNLNLTDGVFWNGTIDMRGSATVVASTYDGGSTIVSNFTFTGAEEQTLDLTGATAALDSSVVVNKSGGTLTMLSGYNLDYSDKTFTLQAGTLNPNGNSFATLAFTQSGGTFAAQAGALDFNGAFVLSGGTFNASSGTMNMSGSFTHTAGGTFNHQNGSIIIDSSFSITWNVAVTEELYNLTVNHSHSSQAITIASGDTLNVNGALTLTDGFFITGTIAAKGPTVSIGPAFGMGTNDSGTLLINGSGAQSVTIAPQTDATFEIADQFTLNNASATVTGTGTTGNLGFDKVTLTAGVLNATGYTFTANEALTIGGGTLTLGSGTATVTGDFSQSAGTFSGGSGTVDFNGAITISGGTFTASSGSTYLAGSFTHTAGGTFNHNSGTMIFDGGASDYNVATTETFNNVTMNKGGGWYGTLAAGDTFVILGNLNLTNGRFNGGTIDMRGPATVVASTYGLAGSTALTFTGSADQTFDLTGATNRIDSSITVNKASGTVSLLSNLTLDAGGQDLLIQGGTWDSNGYVLNIVDDFNQSGGTFIGGSGSLITIDFFLSGGTFTAPLTTTVYNNWTHTAGGTFDHNNGTVDFSGSGSAGGTIDVNASETFYNFTFSKGGGWDLTVAAGDVLIVTGTTSITSGATSTFFGTPTLDVRGNVVIRNAAIGAAFWLFSGTNDQTIDATGFTGGIDSDITINKPSGTVQLNSDLVLDVGSQDLILTSGTLYTNGYSLTVNGASAMMTVASGATFAMNGNETITTLGSYPTLSSGSTVRYSGTAGPYTMKNYTYHHLVIAGGANSVFTQAANESYGGNVTITSGILSQGGFTTTVTGTFSNSGTLRRLQAETFTGTMDVDSGTVEYVGDGDGSVESVTVTDFGGTDYYNLKINDVNATKDTFTIGGGLVVAGELSVPSSEFIQGANTVAASDLVINGGTYTGSGSTLDVGDDVTISSGTFTAPSGSLLIGGDITKSGGTFTHNSGAVTFDPGLSHSVTGSFTWNDLTLTDQSDDATDASLTVEAGSTQTFEGDVVFDGLDATDRVNILSSSTGNEATFAFAGASTFTGDYLDIKDNAVTDSSSGTSVPLNPSNSVENGNTTNWFTDGGFTVSVVSGNTTEAGGTATFTVVLTAQPVADVVIPLSSSDTSEGTVSPASLTFTSVNWATPQTVTITGQNDFLDDGNIEYTIVIGAVTSGDWGYNGLNPDDRTLSNVDSDTSGMTVSAISGDTEEDGTAATFTVVLTAQPTGNVVVLSESSNEAEGIVTSGATLTFTSVNWATPQTVTVTGQDDSTSDGDIDYTIAVTIDTAATADALYDAVAAAEVTVTNLDDDQGGGRSTPQVIPPTVYILNPTSAAAYEVGDRVVWYWDACSSLTSLALEVREKGQNSWDVLRTMTSGVGSWTWTIPSSYASQTLDVRLVGYTSNNSQVIDEVSSWIRVLALGEELVEDGDVEEEETDPETEAELLCPLSQGSYVKLSWLPAVYYIDANCTRRPFLDAVSYFTYQDDFSGVQLVETSVLQQTSLGKPMGPNPGRVLVKVQSVPAVYVVEPVEGLDRIATLRWIPTEDVARSVIGESWNKYIIDLPPTLFTHFTFGDDVEEDEVVDREDLMVPRY